LPDFFADPRPVLFSRSGLLPSGPHGNLRHRREGPGVRAERASTPGLAEAADGGPADFDRLQLNVRNGSEKGRLQPIAVNPEDGACAVRSSEPRMFILSTRFDRRTEARAYFVPKISMAAAPVESW
jgi:hypothetical protein